jgi:hypothetical protein
VEIARKLKNYPCGGLILISAKRWQKSEKGVLYEEIV